MRIGEICTREVIYCTPDTAVAEVARPMRNFHVGDLIVAEPREGRIVAAGIVTDRDLVVEFLAEAFTELARIVPRQAKVERNRRAPLGT